MTAMARRGRSRWLAFSLVMATVFGALGVLPAAYRAETAQAASVSQAVGCSGTTTPSLTEGPYYKAGSPERTSLLEANMPGTKVVLTGYVYDKNCRPVAHAWLDFWQADANGRYDNSGYTLRGHQYTDANGRYTLETVEPGEYPGRTVHFHVKVQA